MQQSYLELISGMVAAIRSTPPARLVEMRSLQQLLQAVACIQNATVLILTTDPQQVMICCEGQCGEKEEHRKRDLHILPLRPGMKQQLTYNSSPIPLRMEEVHMPSVIPEIERHFSWFGRVHTIYMLGGTVVALHMDTLSAEFALRTPTLNIAIPRNILVYGEHPTDNILIRVRFNLHDFKSDCLTLNTILSLLKHVNPNTVVMIRRVNRLGFPGSRLVKEYFENQYGKVARVFMLPLRSHKRNSDLPSKTGFVVMYSEENCDEILKKTDHFIQAAGQSISVGKFTHKGAINEE